MSNLAVDQTNVTPGQMLLDATNPRERQMLLIEREFEMEQRTASVFAKSDIVPDQFKGKIADCIIAQEMAHRLGVGVIEIMQNLDVIYGRPAFRAAYVIARINSSGLIKGRIKFNFVGTEGQDDWGCYASAIDAETGEEIKGPTVTIAIAKAEGWYNKNGSKWKTIPDLMLRYRAGSWLGRTQYPEATMGMLTHEEAEDIGPRQERDITPLSSTDINDTFKPKLVAKETEEENLADQEQPADQGQEADSEAAMPAEGTAEQESAPFISLKAELLKTRSAETAEAMLKAPALKRAKASEQEKFAEMVANHIEAIKAGMLPNE